MKIQILVYTIIISSIPSYSWAQNNPLNEKKIAESQSNSTILHDRIDTPKRKIKYYHVEEIYEMKFGSHRTVYNVSNPKLIQTYDLGPNNKRIITPVYEKDKAIVETSIKSNALKEIENSTKLSIANSPKKTDADDLHIDDKSIVTLALTQKEQLNETLIKLNSSNTIENSTKLSIADSPKKTDADDLHLDNKSAVTPVLTQKEQLNETLIKLNSSNTIENSTKLSITNTPKKAEEPSYIDIIKTYEGIIEKGYETLDILKKVANSLYFNNQLEKAEKYYKKLFNKTTDLEPEYYYRYSVALKSIGQVEKASEFFKKFKQLSSDGSR